MSKDFHACCAGRRKNTKKRWQLSWNLLNSSMSMFFTYLCRRRTFKLNYTTCTIKERLLSNFPCNRACKLNSTPLLASIEERLFFGWNAAASFPFDLVFFFFVTDLMNILYSFFERNNFFPQVRRFEKISVSVLNIFFFASSQLSIEFWFLLLHSSLQKASN